MAAESGGVRSEDEARRLDNTTPTTHGEPSGTVQLCQHYTNIIVTTNLLTDNKSKLITLIRQARMCSYLPKDKFRGQ